MQKLKIIDYTPDLSNDFKSINIQWLEDMFKVEPIDLETLSDPKKYILSGGGHILFAQSDELGVVGTCALQQT